MFTHEDAAGIKRRSVDDSGVDKIPDLFSLRDECNVDLCSATLILIQPLLLLTAAHCILGKSLKGMKAIRAGPIRDLISGTEHGLAVRQISIHPNFDPNTLDNDIALLRLDRHAHQYDSSTARVSQITPSTWKLPEMATISGWDLGHTTTVGVKQSSVFEAHKIRTFRRSDCLTLYESNDSWNRTIGDNMFCSRYVGEDSCKEIQSGTLLFCGTDYSYICGIGCGSEILPMVYTDVSKHVPWIEMHMWN